jgi:hypothetical protein
MPSAAAITAIALGFTRIARSLVAALLALAIAWGPSLAAPVASAETTGEERPAESETTWSVAPRRSASHSGSAGPVVDLTRWALAAPERAEHSLPSAPTPDAIRHGPRPHPRC